MKKHACRYQGAKRFLPGHNMGTGFQNICLLHCTFEGIDPPDAESSSARQTLAPSAGVKQLVYLLS